MSRRAAAFAVLGALFALLFAAPTAVAQDEQAAGLTIRSVDGTDPEAVVVDFVYNGDRADFDQLTVTEDGERRDFTQPELLDDQDQTIGVVLAIDTSGSMEIDARFERARDAARTFVENKDPRDQLAIVGFNGEVSIAQDFTDDPAELLAAIDDLGLAAQTALYDAVKQSAALFDGRDDLQPNIVLLTDGEDTGSATSADAARGLISESGALVFLIAVGDEAVAEGALGDIVEASGGEIETTTDPANLGGIYGDIQQTLRNQYRLTFPSGAEDGGLTNLVLSVGSQRASAEFTPGSRTSGAQLVVTDTGEPPGPELFRTTGGFYLALALVLAAVGLAVYSIATTFTRDQQGLDNVLQPYADGFVASSEDADDDDRQHLATSPLLQRAVQLTSDLAERQGVLDRVEKALERANVPLRAAEALFFYLAVVIVSFLLATVISQNLIVGLVVAVIVALAGPATLSYLANKRKRDFQAQLPDMLQLLSGTLRAGYSLMQGVEAVGQEVEEPMGREIRRVVTEARLGRPLEESLEAVADRMDSPDFAWAVMAIRIQREVGGNLSELLLTVAETMVARERLRRDVSALTAEGRISAIVLGILPVALGFAMYVINPEYIETLFDETMGQVMLVGAVILAGVGFYWMKKTIEIDI